MNKKGKLMVAARTWYNYVTSGVWSDPRDNMKVRIIKSLNLTVSSFLDRGLQLRSMALTYNTVLAVVPAFALLIAIGRGFGMQDSLARELFVFFPSQAKAIATGLTFVDSYLKQASSGVFVGVGIVVLLWTLISLLSSIEDAFNFICDVKKDRTIYQKITDYIAIFLIVPVLLICSSGLSIFMSSTIQNVIHLPFLTPVLDTMLELFPVVLCWLAFSFSFYLIPNTRISFKYASISGAICAVAFQVFQMLMIGGQIYVSKYNAIYGSFAFLPLLLVWLQISWLLLLSGCVLTYSLQNVFAFNFIGNHSSLSEESEHLIALVVMATVSKRFVDEKKPLTVGELASRYFLPVKTLKEICDKIEQAGIFNVVKLKDNRLAVAPAREVSSLTVADFLRIYSSTGKNEYMKTFRKIYSALTSITDKAMENTFDSFGDTLVVSLPIPSPSEIKDILGVDDKELQPNG